MQRFCLIAVLCVTTGLAADQADDQISKALNLVVKQRKPDEAVALLDKLLKADSKNAQAYFVRGLAFEAKGEHKKAVADFTKVIELAPKSPGAGEAYNLRGSERFKLGDIKGSIADFDEFLRRRPDQEPGHWKRGISYYYAKEFDKGAKQFKGYEEVDTNDVENAVWHFLCNARKLGVDKARKQILKIGKDGRVPMMTVYALFKGEKKPEDVLADAKAGNPGKEKLNRQLFYAHLYLGLYYEALGDKKKALEHLTKAADDHRIGHYMWDVARVHSDLLEQK